MVRISLLATVSAAVILSQASAQQLIGDGITDNTPIWNQIVTNVCASNDRKVNIGMGTFRFASPMNGIPCSLQVQGEGPGISLLKFDYTGTHAYYVVGGIDPYGGGSLRDVSMTVTSGNTIDFALWIQAHLETNPDVESHNPHGFTLDNTIISRDFTPPYTGSWNYGIYLDGSLNASPPPGVAIGVRYTRILHSSVSGWNILPALAYYAYGARFVAFDCYIGMNPNQPYQIQGANDMSSTSVINGSPNVTCPYVHTGQ